MATTVQCVEPAAGQYAHFQSDDDIISFPHVDSCLAIAAVLGNGRIAGGHVGMFWGGPVPDASFNHLPTAWPPDPAGCASAVVFRMLALMAAEALEAKHVRKLILLGADDWFVGFDPETGIAPTIVADAVAAQFPAAKDVLRIHPTPAGGADLVLDAAKRTFTATSCSNGSQLYTTPFIAVNGATTVALKAKPHVIDRMSEAYKAHVARIQEARKKQGLL